MTLKKVTLPGGNLVIILNILSRCEIRRAYIVLCYTRAHDIPQDLFDLVVHWNKILFGRISSVLLLMQRIAINISAQSNYS